MKARQKTKPKYAARHLVRVLFPKKTLLCSVMGASARGRRTLDPNKIAAIRGMLPFKMHRFTSFILNEVLKLKGVLFCMFLANHCLATGEQINVIVECVPLYSIFLFWKSCFVILNVHFSSICIKLFRFLLVLCASWSSVMLSFSKFLIAVYFVFVCAMDFVSVFLFGWFGLVYSHGILGTNIN